MAQGLGNITVDHQVMLAEAQKLADERVNIMECIKDAHAEMTEVAETMQGEAGEKLIERFNNLTEQYFDRYANSMADHINFLCETANRYIERDEKLKDKVTTNAFERFDNV